VRGQTCRSTCTRYSDAEPTLLFPLIHSGLEPTICRTRGKHTNHYTTDTAVCKEDGWWNLLVYGVRRHFQQYFSHRGLVLLVEETEVPEENH
jgi:hypothetical protein